MGGAAGHARSGRDLVDDAGLGARPVHFDPAGAGGRSGERGRQGEDPQGAGHAIRT